MQGDWRRLRGRWYDGVRVEGGLIEVMEGIWVVVGILQSISIRSGSRSSS